ncbi:helix-turn-helix transcriptional regulator [Octadecabacter sp. R77987]|uniref:S24 family peptidase n=1 Tax=Octadecabacter sp. R77987 TaxID=3093874 RepID=UPI00366C85E1
MDPILDAIDKALQRKGITAAAASRLAVGNPSLIKNMRADTGTDKRYNAAALQKLAAVLDLEFYFGPERAAPTVQAGFGEAATTNPTGPREALRAGFLPIPYHRAASPQFQGTAPVALSRAWVAARDLVPEHLSFAPVLDDAMSPALRKGALTLIDASQVTPDGQGIFCATDRGVLHYARLETPAPDLLAVTQDNRPMRVLRGDEKVPYRILGKVVWVCDSAA